MMLGMPEHPARYLSQCIWKQSLGIGAAEDIYECMNKRAPQSLDFWIIGYADYCVLGLLDFSCGGFGESCYYV